MTRSRRPSQKSADQSAETIKEKTWAAKDNLDIQNATTSNLGLDITLNNEIIQQLSVICGDRDAWRDRLVEYGITYEVIHDLFVPDDECFVRSSSYYLHFTHTKLVLDSQIHTLLTYWASIFFFYNVKYCIL